MLVVSYYKFLFISLHLLLLFRATVRAHVFETGDAVVTKIVNSGSMSVAGRHRVSILDELDWLGDELRNLFTVSDRSCMTFDRQPGTCLSVRECYPYTKLHQSLSPLETWVIGTLGTCNFREANGRQVYGVCCHARPLQSQNENLPVLSNGHVRERIIDIAGSRIVNGKNADEGEYPFMAAIVDGGRHTFCGGTLIDSTHVLTAAHCFSGLSARRISRLVVVFGVIDLKDPKKVIRNVKTVVRHKEFDSRKLRNDVALLTLDAPVQFTSSVSPVCLDNSLGANNDGKDAQAIGWGRIRDRGPKAQSLQKVTLQLKSLDDCRQNLGSKAPGGVVDHYICAWAPSKDACDGDSGGPLMLDNCQIGIVSWGIGCASSKYGVYTRVASFHDWIERNKARF